MGNETSVPEGQDPFQDEPNEFHPPTMEESRGAGKESTVQQQEHAHKGLGRGALIARLTHRNQQNNAQAAEAATLAGENGVGPYDYTEQHQQQAVASNGEASLPQSLTYQNQQSLEPRHGKPPQHLQAQAPGQQDPTAEGARAGAFKRNIKNTAQKSGRGLINSMRSLSIKTAGLKTTGMKSNDQAADWERQWDDDEESSEEEDEVDTTLPPAPGAGYVHQPLRPGMDGGHSTFTPLSRAAEPLATPSSTGAATPSATPELIPTRDEDALAKQADIVMQQGENAVQWDTADKSGVIGRELEPVYEKPKVEMFLPMLRVLGKGSFGKVVLVQKRVGQECGGLFAMKILRKSHLVKRRQIERTKTERKVLSVVDHPFIMKLHFAFQSIDKLYLVLDYCPGGELFFHLSRFRRFPERVARFYAAELLLAIGHLHKRGIIYRDLKPENVLLDADGHVKLGDFGLAKDKIRHPWEGATSMCGTPEYMAPEVLSQSGHGFCVDYWGLGMLVYEMMTGLPPWYTTDRAKLFRRLKSAPLEVPSYFSPHAAAYVSALLERNPRRRLGVTGIRGAMEHEFFRSINWRALYARRVEAPIRPCEGWKPPDASSPSVREHTDANGPENMSSAAIDVAVANFDNTFTRMPVASEDNASSQDGQQYPDEGDLDELNEDTFLGFTYDEFNDNDVPSSSPPRQRSARQLD